MRHSVGPLLYHKKGRRKSAAVCQMHPINTEKEYQNIEVGTSIDGFAFCYWI